MNVRVLTIKVCFNRKFYSKRNKMCVCVCVLYMAMAIVLYLFTILSLLLTCGTMAVYQVNICRHLCIQRMNFIFIFK